LRVDWRPPYSFSLQEKKERELKFRDSSDKSTQQGQSVRPASGDHTENAVSAGAVSLKRFPLGGGGY